MKYAIDMRYNTVLVFDADTFGKIAPLLAKGDPRTKEGYGGDAKFLPATECLSIITLQERQLVEVEEEVVAPEVQ